MFEGSCHCGQITWTFEGEIDRTTACNCTICRRYGALWAYGYKDENIKVSGPTREYSRGRKHLGFHFCNTCGCMAYWLIREPNQEGQYRIAVNTRLINDPVLIQTVPIRHFDGFESFKEYSGEQKCVQGMWF